MRKSVLLIFLSLGFLHVKSQVPSFREYQKVVAFDRDTQDYFGLTAIYGRNAIITSSWEDEDSSGTVYIPTSGSAYAFRRDSTGQWNLIQKIKAADADTLDLFGSSVAMHRNYTVIGAPYDGNDTTNGPNIPVAGSAYIFKLDSNGFWKQQQKVFAFDRDTFDFFGGTVAIYGNYAFVGANTEDDDPNNKNPLYDAGSVYVFNKKSNGKWINVQKLVASDRKINDLFGGAIDIDSNIAVISAVNQDRDENGQYYTEDAGTVYIFELDSVGVWNEVQKLVASDRYIKDYFGSSVSLNGNYLLVGASSEDEDENGKNFITDAGSAYMFERGANGQWTEVQKLAAFDRYIGDAFGSMVDLTGQMAVIGAPMQSENKTQTSLKAHAGAAYIYLKSSNGKWIFADKIVASDRDAGDNFGGSIGISDNQIVIGAAGECNDVSGSNYMPQSGSAYFFNRNVLPVIKDTKLDSTISVFYKQNNLPGQEVMLSPNPTHNTLLISSSNTILNIHLYNMAGQNINTVVKAFHPGSNQLMLDLSDIPRGVYLIKVNTHSASYIKKVVKQ